MLAGYPFPIPKTGYEAIWNHLLRYSGLGYDGSRYDNWNVDSAGVPTLAVTGERFLGVADLRSEADGRRSAPASRTGTSKLLYVGPARRNGEALLIVDAVNPLKQPRRAWQYLPGTAPREARAGPGLRHAEPGAAGAATYDDVSVFNGAMDRFDWKLVGKKEMYVPYSSYRLTYHKNPADITKPNHLNPDFVRWELHRVWVVEATLKPGKRHIYSKRTFYLDEDSWTALAADQYDARGQLYRSSFAFQSYSYDVQAPFGDTFAIYDFNSGAYNISGLFGAHNGPEVHDRAAAGHLLVAGGAGRSRRPLMRILAAMPPSSGARVIGASPARSIRHPTMTTYSTLARACAALALAMSLAAPAHGAGFVDVLDTPAQVSPLASRSLLQAVTRRRATG